MAALASLPRPCQITPTAFALACDQLTNAAALDYRLFMA
jgi:hypothetical protein